MRAGATGYLLRGTPIDDMIAILSLALRGYFAIGRREHVKASESDFNIAARLSERERQIWSLIGEGKTNRDIAEQLFLTKGTVRLGFVAMG
jgi:DNA-binding NarL/FixJ family response regulator